MAYAQSSAFSSRRALIFVGIVLLHVGFVWILNAGLAQTAVERVFGPIETKIIEETKEDKKTPPPPPPKMEIAPPPFVPPPEVSIELPVESTTSAISNTTSTKPVPKPVAPVAVARVAAKPTKRSMEDLPEYPPQSKRLGEEGSTTLRMYCNVDGRITEAQMAETSGFPRLDEASMRWATHTARCTPGSESGKPSPMWFDFRVKWQIKKE